MAGLDPNTIQGMMAYWNDRDSGGGSQARARHAQPRRHEPAPPSRTEELAAQRRAERDAIANSIMNKFVYLPGLIHSKSSVPTLSLQDLAKAGINMPPVVRDARGQVGHAAGLPVDALTPDERAHLGLPSAPTASSAPPQDDLAALYGGS